MSYITDKIINAQGEQWRVTLYADVDTRPDDFECYSPDQIKAWRKDEWYFVGILVTSMDRANRQASVYGVEYGWLPGVGDITLDTMCADTQGHVADLIDEILSAPQAPKCPTCGQQVAS